MPARLLQRLLTRARAIVRGLRHQLIITTRPTAVPVATGALVDLARGKSALLAENALLRHQLAILRRSVGGRAAPGPTASAPGGRRC